MKSLGVILWATGLLFVAGCGNKVNFSGQSGEQSLVQPELPPIIDPQNPDAPPQLPPVEPPVEPPTVVSPIQLRAGTCAVGGENILTCLNCASTNPTPPPPLLSQKAQSLWDIMTVACSIHNKSDPKGYVPPSREQLLKRLIQCSPTAYPDTNFEATQSWTINELLNNPKAQKSAFGGLYYNWATTDFETYFGLDIGEARYTFCRGQYSFGSHGIYPKEYYDSLYSGIHYTLPQIYVRAQRHRNDLRNCLAASWDNPDRPQQPGTPGTTCEYQTAEGAMGQQIVDQANKWINEGHTVYFEGFNQCGVMNLPEQYFDYEGSVKLAIKTCR